MTGALTLEIQELTHDDLVYLLTEAGQLVTIKRPGHADVQVQALLLALDDKAAEGRVNAPDVKLVAWQGIFLPDAPIREIPFHVVDSAGVVFIPDSPVQDPGNQGVVLIAHLLPLVERTRTEVLTFTAPGTGTTTDGKGNPVPTPGQPFTVPVRLSASADPRIREMVGADAAEVALLGRWGTLYAPLMRPPGVVWGKTAPLTLDGQAGTLTIKLAYPDADLATELQMGARFACSWRAGK